jgi:hypothetical protein
MSINGTEQNSSINNFREKIIPFNNFFVTIIIIMLLLEEISHYVFSLPFL